MSVDRASIEHQAATGLLNHLLSLGLPDALATKMAAVQLRELLNLSTVEQRTAEERRWFEEAAEIVTMPEMNLED